MCVKYSQLDMLILNPLTNPLLLSLYSKVGSRTVTVYLLLRVTLPSGSILAYSLGLGKSCAFTSTESRKKVSGVQMRSSISFWMVMTRSDVEL